MEAPRIPGGGPPEAMVTSPAVERDRIAQSVAKYVRQGQLKRAIPEMEKLVMAEPSSARLRLELADLLQRADEKTQAVEQLCQVARRYEKDGFGIKALGVYLQVQRLQPANREAALALGRHYCDHGLYSEAARAWDKALQAAPDEAQRLSVIQSILDHDPDNIGDRVRLAEAYSGLGALQDAARELRRVADVLEHKAGDAEYPRVAERLLYHQPDDAAVAKKLAAIYLSQEDPQRALPKLRKAYEARPQDLEILGLLAESFNQLGQIHKSVAVLKEMARIYDQSGLLHERDECWTRVLQLDPTDPQAREVLRAPQNETVGTTIEVPYHAGGQAAPNFAKPGEALQFGAPVAPAAPAPQAFAAAPAAAPNPGVAKVGTATSAPTIKSNSDFDDFELSLDSDEPGFGGTVENTIVDDAFVPDDPLGGGPEGGLALTGGGPDVVSGALQEDLRELDFYVNNGLVSEADALLKELVQRHGEHPLLDRRAQQVAKLR